MATWSDFYASPLTVEQEAGNLAMHAPLLAEVTGHDARRILEVGVGTGSMSRFIAQRGVDVVGVDVEPTIVDWARDAAKRVVGVEYRVADAFSLTSTFLTKEFDCAFSQGFFEHFSDDQLRDLVREQLAVARRVVFSVPSDNYPQRDFGNERLLGPDEWRSILKGVGEVEATYYGMVPSGYRLKIWRVAVNPLWRPMHVLVSITDPEVPDSPSRVAGG